MNSEYQIQMDLFKLNLNQENKTFNYGFNNYNYYYNFNNNNNDNNNNNTLNYLSQFENKVNGNYYLKNYNNNNKDTNNYFSGNYNNNNKYNTYNYNDKNEKENENKNEYDNKFKDVNSNNNDNNYNTYINRNYYRNGNGNENVNGYMNYNNNNNNNYFPKRNINGILAKGNKKYFNDNNNNNYNYNNKNFNNGKSNNFFYNNNGYNNNNNKYFQYNKKSFTYKMRWDGYDPFTMKSLIFRAQTFIMNRYPNLGMLNNKNEGFSNRITNKSKYFIIKSFNEEDVHKAIKYSLWCSTNSGNQTLNEAFKQSKKEDGEVYLFFSCNGSGRYIGIAKMINQFNENKQFNYWTQDSKWKGYFDVEWIYIKDIPFKCFKMINITMK
jgi:hypothetical protein